MESRSGIRRGRLGRRPAGTPELPGPLATTAIGSLPHLDPEPAVELAFTLDIPGLPELPRRSAAEFLLARGLFGLPGLAVGEGGACSVDEEAWRRERLSFQKILKKAVDDPGSSPLAPPAEAFSAWQPFLREIRVRHSPFAKVQLVGPLTAGRMVLLDGGRPLAAELPIANQVFQLLVSRALAMVQAVREVGARPLFFFDEPGLVGMPLGAARQLMALQELRAAVTALRRAGALVGLHCCGEAQWERLLPLGFDFLSFDAALSLSSVLARRAELAAFADPGGRLALGIAGTEAGGHQAELSAIELAEELRRIADAAPGGDALLGSALLTPACGLALRTVAEAEALLARLGEVREALARGAGLA